VLIPVQHLLDRLRHPRSRADELRDVRRRLAAAPGPGEATAEELSAAQALRRLREELSAALSGVESCSGCASGHPLPHGRWDGGHCCGCATTQVFTDDEIAALRLGGTTPARLAAPAGDHAGCAFRGPGGCSLDAADRPSICVRYVCRELEDELRGRGDRASVKAIAAELGRTFERFRALRAARRDLPRDPAAEAWDDVTTRDRRAR
jgi:hypothetical protein